MTVPFYEVKRSLGYCGEHELAAPVPFRAALCAALCLGALFGSEPLHAKSLIALEPCRIADADGLSSTEARCGKFSVPEDPDDPKARDRARRRRRPRGCDESEAGPALPHRRRAGTGIDRGLRADSRRLRRDPPRARPRARGPARHGRLEPARLRHAGRCTRRRRDRARRTARARKRVPRGPARPAAVLHDEHRGARPRRRARGARLRRDQRLRRLLRHPRRAALRAPLSRAHAHRHPRRRRAAGARARARDRDRVAARARSGVRALRGRQSLQLRTSPRSPRSSRSSTHACGRARSRSRSPIPSPAASRTVEVTRAHLVTMARMLVYSPWTASLAPARRARGGDERELRAARRAGGDGERRPRAHDRDGHAQLGRLRRGRAALRRRRGPQGARGDRDRAADAGRHEGHLRGLAARAGGRGFREAARLRRSPRSSSPASSTRRRLPSYGAIAAKGFANGLHLVVPGQGHGQSSLPCVQKILRQFIDAGTTRDLDTSCVARIRPAPFFLSFSGSAP